MTLLGPIFGTDPDAIAFVGGSERISYGRLCEDVDTLAWWLHDRGIGAGSGLGIQFKGGLSYWVWVAHLAAIRIGARHATIDSLKSLRPAMGADGNQLDAYLFAGAALRNLPPSLRPLSIEPRGFGPLAEQLGVKPRAWTKPETECHAARIALTSGTTGRPHALLWTYDIMADRIAQAGSDIVNGAQERLCPLIGTGTTAGFRYPIAAWRAGAAVLSWSNGNDGRAVSHATVQRSTLLVISPANLRTIISSSKSSYQGHGGRTLIVLGARVPTSLRDAALRTMGARVNVHYGSTETGRVAGGDAALTDRHPGAVGFASGGATIEIVDADGVALPAGEAGIVRIRTPSMCGDYLPDGNSDRQSSIFKDGWFYPGDHGILFEDGLLAIEGRATETVNIGGIKISLPDIESRLLELPGIADACAIRVAHRKDDLLVIVLVSAQDHESKPLHEAIGKMVPKNTPFRIVKTRAIARNAAGKVQRDVLAQKLLTLIEKRETDG